MIQPQSQEQKNLQTKIRVQSRAPRQTTSEPLDFDEFKGLLGKLRENGEYKWELYCLVSFCTAFRVSDVKTTTWEDIFNKNDFVKIEQKTQKMRKIPIGHSFQKRLRELYSLMGCPDMNSTVLLNERTGGPYSTQYINRTLKKWIGPYRLSIKKFSTHSFRKTFGRYVWEMMGKTMEALMLLCLIFKHDTMIYIGIRQDEINGVFKMIELD